MGPQAAQTKVSQSIANAHGLRRMLTLGRLMHRKPKMLAAIALANKMARQLWAMLTNNVDYHDPATRVAA